MLLGSNMPMPAITDWWRPSLSPAPLMSPADAFLARFGSYRLQPYGFQPMAGFAPPAAPPVPPAPAADDPLRPRHRFPRWGGRATGRNF